MELGAVLANQVGYVTFLHIWMDTENDSFLQKARGIKGLNNCICRLSEAISIMTTSLAVAKAASGGGIYGCGLWGGRVCIDHIIWSPYVCALLVPWRVNSSSVA
ncbi:hypothetical protein M8C21_018772 [Ambrosia artemisiifolia]|uniref:Uncharacterized protein n=1 Tax=Ambrosia artemisiifolia TaxID=4212 RepID=A0AAD5CA81_AMBAR|nr:hypothetical protein M8C21_018772 [Ambrosia artemisiifolia]